MAKTKKGKELSNDQLGRMIQRGFAEERTHTDGLFKTMIGRFEIVEADIKDIKTTLGPLVSIAVEHERKFNKIESRLRRLEYKVGINN